MVVVYVSAPLAVVVVVYVSAPLAVVEGRVVAVVCGVCARVVCGVVCARRRGELRRNPNLRFRHHRPPPLHVRLGDVVPSVEFGPATQRQRKQIHGRPANKVHLT